MNKKYFGILLFLLLIPSLPFLFNVDIKLYLYIVLISFVSLLGIQYLFSKHIKNIKISNLLYYTFVFQYFIILWTYNAAINSASIIHPFVFADAGLYYSQATNALSQINPIGYLRNAHINYIGYPLILTYWFKLLYSNFLLGLLLNIIINLINTYLIARITFIITKNNKVVYYSILFYSISPQMNTAATYLLKDVFIIMSLLLIVLASLLIYNKKNTSSILYVLLGSAIIATFRLPMLPFFLITAYYITLKTINTKQIILFFALFGLTFLIYNSTKDLANKQYLSSVDTIINRSGDFSNVMKFDNTGGNSITERLVLGYENWPIIKRIAFIPIFGIVQYLTPFNFWNFNHEIPWDYIKNNLQVIWFFFLGALLIFSLLNYKSIKNDMIKRLFIMSILGFTFIAYLYGGTLPRYAYPFYALFIIVTAYIYNEIKINKNVRVKYLYFSKYFNAAVIVLATLYLSIRFF